MCDKLFFSLKLNRTTMFWVGHPTSTSSGAAVARRRTDQWTDRRKESARLWSGISEWAATSTGVQSVTVSLCY